MAAPYLGPSFLPVNPPPDESDVEAELEVDQLDSDSEVDELADPSKPKSSKNGSSRPGERVPGHTLLPTSRIENIVQAEGVTGSLGLSREAMFVLSIATEDFMKRFIQAGHREAAAHRRNQINYIDMAASTQQYQEYRFLLDTIPGPVPLQDALMLRSEKERELLEDNPALLPPISPVPWHPPPMPEHPLPTIEYEPPKPPKKSRSSTNGKDKANGSGSKRSSKKPMTNGHPIDAMMIDSTDSPSGTSYPPSEVAAPSASHSRAGHPSMAMSSLAASASIPPTTSNGEPPVVHSRSPSPTNSRDEPMDSVAHAAHAPPPANYPESHSPPYHGQDESWSGSTPFTGPSSGFLRGSGIIPFSRSGNPGRTIYSQNHTS